VRGPARRGRDRRHRRVARAHRADPDNRDFGVAEADLAQIAGDALDDDVPTNTPRPPAASDI
jgi:alcohol dehydrogenase class IV